MVARKEGLANVERMIETSLGDIEEVGFKYITSTQTRQLRIQVFLCAISL